MPEGAIVANAITDPITGKIVEERPAPAFKYLVLEGGGVRGVAYGGVDDILEKAGVIEEIEHIAGTSVGAISGMLMAIGYGASEAESLLADLPFKDLLEGKKPWPFTPDFITKFKQYISILFNNGYSVSSGQLLFDWLEDKLEKRVGKKDLTFAELARLVENQAGHHPYKYLSVVATNLTKDRAEVFNHQTTPNMSIAQAVRMSSSFPGVFKAIEVKEGNENTVFVDGGVKNNLPADIFNHPQYLKWGYGFTEKGVNPHTLCVKVDTGEEILRHGKPIRNFQEFSKAIIKSMITRDEEMHHLYGTNIITVYDGNVPTLKFEINEKEKIKLSKLGKQATLDYLQSHFGEAYWVKPPFENELAWVSSKTDEEIKEIVKFYSAELQGPNTTEEKKHLLTEKISWLKDYLKKRTDDFIEGKDTYLRPPSPHIDIRIPVAREKMDERIAVDLKYKLNLVTQELLSLERQVAQSAAKINCSFKCLHEEKTHDSIVALTKLKERIKFLTFLQRDFNNKLNIKIEKTQHNELIESLQQFEEVTKMLLLNKKILPDTRLISEINNNLLERLVSLKGMDFEEITLDFKRKDEMKLYVMGLMIYLKYFNLYPNLQEKLKPFYTACFATDTVPKNMDELAQQLNKKELELFCDAYRLECLLNYFSTLDKPNVLLAPFNLDEVFLKLTNQKAGSIKKAPAKNEIEELDLIFKSATFRLTDGFLMFHQPEKELEIKIDRVPTLQP